MNEDYENYEEEYEDDSAYGRAEAYEIPERVQHVIDKCNKVLGCGIELYALPIVDYYGYPIAYAKGFTICDCLSSIADGPHFDYSAEALEILKPFGFKVAQTRYTSDENPWTDKYRYTDVIYEPSENYI